MRTIRRLESCNTSIPDHPFKISDDFLELPIVGERFRVPLDDDGAPGPGLTTTTVMGMVMDMDKNAVRFRTRNSLYEIKEIE